LCKRIGWYPNTDDCCSNDPGDWISIKFPKDFNTIPAVIVTHEISALHPEFADSYFSISGVTKSGFQVQRRNLRNMICNQLATVNYVAVGKQKKQIEMNENERKIKS